MEVRGQELALLVLHEGAKVGRLKYEPASDEFTFAYDSEWIAKKRFSLSPHILTEKIAGKGAVTRFLENLLPEGDGLRSLAQTLKVNPANIYALISAIGAETTGALMISMTGDEPESKFRSIARTELVARIAERRERPITNWDGKPRLSVAGVQEKLPVIEREGEFGLGEGALASTHILKFGNEKANHLVINEYFCMRLARAVGLPVAECEVLDLGERVLKVRRFDREWQGNERVRRIHVIDGCQVLDLSPKMKYERFLGDQAHVSDITGPATLKNIYGFCSKTLVPAKAQLELLRWVAFNLLIGNSDNHVKNISFFVTDEGMSLAPFYDLVSVTMYQQFEQALAFQIGDTFSPDEVNAYHLAEMASDLNLKKTFVATQFKRVTQGVLKAMVNIDIEARTGEESQFMADLKSAITERCEKFLAEIPEISKFRSV